ncbi:unnamed protein product, partial [marine sediment metagenome]
MAAGNEFSGITGQVTFAGGSVQGVKAFTVTVEGDIGEYNNWSSPDDWVRLLLGVKRWSGSITMDMQSDEATIEPHVAGAFVGTCFAGLDWQGDIVIERVTNTVQKSA